MTTIGLIGSGHIGGTVARLAVAAGHDVVLSNSRGPETLTDLVNELGPRARAATAAEAAAAGDIGVVTGPLKAYRGRPGGPPAGGGASRRAARSSSTPTTTTPSATATSPSSTTSPRRPANCSRPTCRS